MTKPGKKTLDEIVQEARTMPPEERLRFIRNACGADEQMHLHARQTLESHAQSLDGGLQGAVRDPERSGTDPAGQMIGPYRIVRSLGQGGMGEVFLAERADQQFQQRVAIKLVRRGVLSRHIQGRLRLERQILANLDHPNIARLFDGGTTPEGMPYIVMEYVEGEPIDTYCDARSLSIEQRLRLFQTVCSAVHRAHQNLVVHRDLKPTNIFVTPAGVPKLLDFGIAKVLDDRQMMHTMAVTQADVRVMTPDHASPEQVRGEAITTASDIYVLGVLLYELLSGCKPFSLEGRRLAELEQAICEETPQPPSAAVASAMSSPDRSAIEQVAELRGSSAAKLRRELRGDLDNIVLMAMRKEPERRYSSVEQFSADIDSYLHAMPVRAQPDALLYRAGKFVRRHSLVVGLSAAFLALLVGFTVTTFIQARSIAHERDVAEAQRARAQAERERAEVVSSFLIDSFRQADPSRARGSAVTAREILDSGAMRITRELRNQPELQATLLDTIGSVYLSLGLASDAQPLVAQGLSIRRELFGSDSLDVAASLYSLNRVYEGRGDLERSEALARESLQISRKLTGPDSLESAAGLCRLGVILQQKGELTNAEELFNQCLTVRTERLGRNHEQITIPLDNLARIAQARHDYSNAERLYRRVLAIDRDTRGEDHPQYIRHLHNLATTIHGKGSLEDAESLYSRAIALYRRILGPEHPETIDALGNMGTLLMDQGRLEEAQTIYQESLALNRKIRGPRHAFVGYDLANLGRLAFKRRRFAEAEANFRTALDIYGQSLPEGHGFIAAAWTRLGRVQIEAGKAREAEVSLEQALDSWAMEYGEDSVDYAAAKAALGRAQALQGRFAQAEAALTQSYPLLVSSARRFDDDLSNQVRRWIEDLYRLQGRPEAAQEYLARVHRRADP